MQHLCWVSAETAPCVSVSSANQGSLHLPHCNIWSMLNFNLQIGLVKTQPKKKWFSWKRNMLLKQQHTQKGFLTFPQWGFQLSLLLIQICYCRTQSKCWQQVAGGSSHPPQHCHHFALTLPSVIVFPCRAGRELCKLETAVSKVMRNDQHDPKRCWKQCLQLLICF